jgi:hypothetical protein
MSAKAVLLLVALLLVPAAAGAQSTLGTIRGTVFDPQRQIVAKAAVLVTDEDTGVPRVVETNGVGDYEAANLRAGRYRIEISATGFKPFQITGVVLSAGDTVRQDANLEIGGATEAVTVSASAGAIQLESQAITGGLTARELQSVPRSSRDFQSFLYLDPNVVGDVTGDNQFQFLGGRTYGASYVQDGQRSTGGIFGDIGNAGPSLDSIAEVKVLSNSYSAEYGGLAGVVVTTRRGGAQYSGSAFYDFNGNGLNALTYAQGLAGLQRNDPVLDTHIQRWGATLGGPLKTGKTFFFGAYDGSDQKNSGFSTIATVPTQAMRGGNFSGASFVIRDPLTGQPFPNNTIPANRLSPVSQRVIDMFYPLPNRPTLSSGLAQYQAPVTPSETRQRYDIRVDHEFTSKDSVFVRFNWQGRDPQTTLENAFFPALGWQQRNSRGRTVSGSWTRVVSSNLLNEFRAGYNYDRANRRSLFNAGVVADQLGVEIPADGRDRLGYPSFSFSGANVPSIIRDQRQNALRDMQSDSISVSDNVTWLFDRHTIKAGGLYSRNHILDGFSAGANEGSGQFVFTGSATGNGFADFLLGLPGRSAAQINTRGGKPLDASAKEFSAFVQDDWKVGAKLTLFLGLRYELLGNFAEKNNLLINFDSKTGALVVPDASITQFLSPGAIATVPIETADQVGVGRELVNSDKNNLSPRVGFAWRVGNDNKTVVRGGLGLFYPTQAAQGIRDALSRSPFRYNITRLNPDYTHAFSTGDLTTNPGFGVNGVDFNLESAEVLQYNLTLERELPGNLGARVTYMGSRYRKLLVNRDINTVRPSTVPFNDEENPEDALRRPYPTLGSFLNVVENAGEGTFNAMQLELKRPYRAGLQLQAAYTLAYSDTNAPDLGNSSLGVVQYAPYNIEADRGPDPSIVRHRFVANATWEVPFGHGKTHGASLPAWADAIAGGWTISTIFQARSGPFLTPYFKYGTDPVFPANTGKAYDTINAFDEAWRPDVVGNPVGARTPDSWFNLDAFALPAPGTTGNAKRGIIKGPGTWVVNFGFYKTVVTAGRLRAEFRATLDNAFNHPQFLIGPQSSMLDLTPLLIDGVRQDGVMNVMNETSSAEQFALGRQIFLGLRVTF